MPTIAIHPPFTRYQDGFARSVGQAVQHPRPHRLAVLVVASRGFNLAVRVDALTGHVTIKRVKGAACQYPALEQVKVGILSHYIRETVIPARLVDPSQLLAIHFGHHSSSGVRVRFSRGDLGAHVTHHLSEQLLAQSGRASRATFGGHPRQIPRAVPIATVRVQAHVGAIHGVITTLGVAVRVRGSVGADHA